MTEGQRSRQRTVLVVDDEKDITDLLNYNLSRERFQVLVAHNGVEAIEIARKKHPDVVVLDWMMPEMDGLETCRYLRKDSETGSIPIIMLTARSDSTEKILGLEMGADDYLTKPFHIRELLARIRALIRRLERPGQEEDKKIVVYKEIRIDLNYHKVTVNGVNMDLTAREIKLLTFLMKHPGRVYTREELLDAVWGNDSFVEPRTVDVHISRLRSLIEPEKDKPRYLLTVRSLGYKFSDEN
ncbi:two-component system, OmpR family, alkaline phosphatase synthesis response regulator PhoP [Syntrophus gentianae]|uniref:Phosphate regulon transcriptional regulatory protein PhoB n=1 Tax=Syntrophus gentianae TaxID=43775 RepID=A0A1H7WX53_9BACT|nr:response regulator [Syntrophus gentianae]SEM25507.1 two-component system, OmpR family, alkaline phosphatase synthesis response regulator PhoP [Syntrophus gentianae]